MNLSQLFKALPRDLQWEVLSEFVGGFTVRYNRLRRLFSGELQEKIMNHTFNLNHWSWRSLRLKPFIRFPFSDYDRLSSRIRNRWNVTSFRCDGTIWDDYDPDNEYDPDLLNIVAVAEFSHRGACVVLFESKNTRQLSYGFQLGCKMDFIGKWYITDVDDSIILPPYEKHIYPSYPNTNKKLGRPVKKMKLHNPIPEVPSRMAGNQIKAWMEGRYIT